MPLLGFALFVVVLTTVMRLVALLVLAVIAWFKRRYPS
jgi:Na+/serine symporter